MTRFNIVKIKIRSKKQIASTVSLPVVHIAITPGSVRFCYVVTYPERKPVFRYLTTTDFLTAARFFVRKGIISGYVKNDNGTVSIYHKNYNTGNEERMYMDWERLPKIITRSEVLDWAEKAEMKRCLMGKPLTGEKIKKVKKGSALPIFCQAFTKAA